MIKLSRYIVKIYRDDIFLGYVKSYRKYINGKYRFEKTKNIFNALSYISIVECNSLKNKLTLRRDMLIYNNSYYFKVDIITEQEIRKSKIKILDKIKIRKGVFKR
jgi:hypothetical protein